MHAQDWLNLFTALFAAMAAILGAMNRSKIAEVHELTNSRFSMVENKLREALAEIGRMRGEPPKSILEAPLPAGSMPDNPAINAGNSLPASLYAETLMHLPPTP